MSNGSPIYLDCAASAPVDARVRELVMRCLEHEPGNAGSRAHGFGERARRIVEQARAQVAALFSAGRGEVIFTSGATESNNLALCGLAAHGLATGKRHIVTSQIEHPAVLEPLRRLEQQGFNITRLAPDRGGRIAAQQAREALRPDTLLVSLMHVNNETGVRQPIEEMAETLGDHPVWLHVDAAQGAGLLASELRHPRIDLISVSGHKIYAPQGVGALIARRRGRERPPLAPLMVGGGQEHGYRPGTQAVALIAGLGLAAELARTEASARVESCRSFKQKLLAGLRPLAPRIHGNVEHAAPHIINLSFPGRLAETVMEATADLIAISHGAACSTQTPTCSHVLTAMGLDADEIDGALRFSWYRETVSPDWDKIVSAIGALNRVPSAVDR